ERSIFRSTAAAFRIESAGMYQQESLPPYLRTLIGFGIRIVVGAALGFACAFIILHVQNNLLRGRAMSDETIVAVSYHVGALLGAIFYPIAWLTVLKGERPVGATIATCLAGIATGIVGGLLLGPVATAYIASFGFWGACAAIYQRREGAEEAESYESYFR
ncbi:MAG TPA: hypothetical protein VEJ20_03100, partial [Candidatus Eremiobacteraceae bacterium]|nr:hypothetical protein [Candidatus Eremiobacteraceae bacterium]